MWQVVTQVEFEEISMAKKSTKSKARTRVRLDDEVEPKPEKPKVSHYEELVEAYEANGLAPVVLNGESLYQTKPMFVTDTGLAKKIFKLVKAGHNHITVCRAVGISRSTFNMWLERGRTGYSRDYEKFYHKVMRCEARAEIDILNTLNSHAKVDWRVNAWKLERRFPEHWGKKDRLKAETTVNAVFNIDVKEDLGKQVLADGTARELARKIIEGNEFGYEVKGDSEK